ncbi:RHS repeat-associated core domain-containing protein [Pseudomonas viridiflava]|uniref:RHS repeat-associated core domain-containing protein n=1 Tax=Pseudomonas viridiflava TaxID=33069 RepID=UPI002158D240|nr:RHS repeat-associated core domain-containing protein [Pseudomonas viridiflava]
MMGKKPMCGSASVLLCTYRYDALDRLASCNRDGQAGAFLFYKMNRLASQIQGAVWHSLLQTEDRVLAQQNQIGNHLDCLPLLIDQQGSVIAAPQQAFTYTAYGERDPSNDPAQLPGFNGQWVDPVTGHYVLGAGYRSFNTVLMRFNSPDSFSPFGEGGINGYAYCLGNPVNVEDPTGHIPVISALTEMWSTLSRRLVNAMAGFRPPPKEMRVYNHRVWRGLDLNDRTKKSGGVQLVIRGHGADASKLGRQGIEMPDKIASPTEFANAFNAKTVEGYKDIKLIACYSAQGEHNSMAAALSKHSGLPVKGYTGSITVDSLGKERLRLVKKNPYKKSDPKYPDFSYEPKWFSPPGKQSTIRKS